MEILGSIKSLLDILGPWLGGLAVGLLLAIFANRRKLVTFNVFHNRIGITTNDDILGNVSVRVGENYNASNLYLSKVLITNRALKDIENIKLFVYVNSKICHLLTETAAIQNSIVPVTYITEYQESIELNDNDDADLRQSKIDLWKTRREYLLPTFNRGATLEVSYLVDAAHGSNPGIYVDADALGVTIKYKQDPFVATHIWGIHIRHAAYAGIFFSFLIVYPLLISIDVVGWVSILISLITGILCALPGALILKAWNYIRSMISG